MRVRRAGGPLSDGPSRPADDFNRVILPMKRGQEYTDYINASFIDVSARQSRVRARVPAPGGAPGSRVSTVGGADLPPEPTPFR